MLGHPKTTKSLLHFVYGRSVVTLLLIFAISHIISALIFATFITVEFSGDKAALSAGVDSLWYRFYFCMVSQIAPGFTEFIPVGEGSRVLSLLNGFIGLLINAIYVAVIVSQVILPNDVFEVCPFLIVNTDENTVEIRLYSKYPADLHYIEFTFFRFFIYETEPGGVLGRTEEISIAPKYRKLLRSRYPYIIRVPLSDEPLEWNHKLDKEGDVRDALPTNWLNLSEPRRGHFYLMIKAATNAGTVYQRKEFRVTPQDIRFGRSRTVIDTKNVSVDDWYNFKNGNWANWNKLD